MNSQGPVTGSASDSSSQLRSFASGSAFEYLPSNAPQTSATNDTGYNAQYMAIKSGKKSNVNLNIGQPARHPMVASTTFATTPLSYFTERSDNIRPSIAIDESDAEAESKCLWKNIGRRGGAVQSRDHEQIYPVCEIYLKALIFSGHGEIEVTAWPESTGLRFNNTMIKAWRKVARMLGKEDEARNDNGLVMPTPHEARKVSDICS